METLQQKTKSDWLKLPELSKTQRNQVLKWISVVLTFAVFNLTIGCRSYFEVKTSVMPSSASIEGVKDAGKTIIIHFGNKKYALKDVQLTNNCLTGMLSDYKMPPTKHPVNPERGNRYRVMGSKNQRFLTKEVHLFVVNFADPGIMQVTIPMVSIVKMEIYDKDTDMTVASWIVGSIGALIGLFFLAALVLYFTSVI